MSNPDDKNEIVGEDAVNAWLDRVRIISVKAIGSSAPKGRSLPFTLRWPVSYAVAADLNAIPLDADNRGFGDHGDHPWSDHHKHGAHPPVPRLDVPPPEPPCPVCAMEVYICRCDEDDLRAAIRERDAQIADKDAQIKTLTAERDEARGHLRAEMDETPDDDADDDAPEDT